MPAPGKKIARCIDFLSLRFKTEHTFDFDKGGISIGYIVLIDIKSM